jgi:hypothetical protein
MKYSNGVDSTILQSWYLKPARSSGMYRSRGVAWMEKSMQDFWRKERKIKQFNNFFANFYVSNLPLWLLPYN